MAHRQTILLDGQHYLPAPGRGYRMGTQPYLPEQRRQGYPTYADLSGEYTIPIESWHGGFGEADFDGRPKYLSGFAIDGSIKGTLLPAMAVGSATTIPASSGPFVAFAQYSSTIYAAGGRYVASWNTGTSQWDSARDLGAGVSATDVAVYWALDSAKYARILYVANGTGAAYQEYNGSGWSTASVRAHRFAVLRNVLWRVTTDPTTSAWSLYSSGDGTNWGGANMVGQGDVPVNALVPYDDLLVAITESQILVIEPDGYSRDVFPGMRFLRYSNNGSRAGVDAGRNTMLIPVREGMMEWAGGFITSLQRERAWESVGPDVSVQNSSVVRGRFTCVAAGGPDVVYAGFTAVADSGSNRFYVLKRRMYPGLLPGDGWHPVARFTVPVTAVFVERVTAANGNPTLWIAVGNDTTDTAIYRVLLPRDNDNPVGDSTVTFATTSRAVAAAIDGGLRTIPKVWLAVEVQATIPASGDRIQVSYSLDDSVFAVLGTVTASGVSTFTFPATAVSRLLSVRLDLTAAGATAPRVHRLLVKLNYRFPRRRVWVLPLVLADRPVPQDQRDAASIESALVALQAGATPVSFTDLRDNTYQVLVEGPSEEELLHTAGEGPESVVMVKLTEWRASIATATAVTATAVFVRAYNSAAKNLTAGTAELVSLDSERADTAIMHETTGSRTGRLTCAVAGIHLITAQVSWSGTWPANWAEARIRVNGSTVIAVEVLPSGISPAPTSERSVELSTLYHLGVDDYVEAIVATQSGATGQQVAASANYSPEVSMVRVA